MSAPGPDPETGESRWWKDVTDSEGNVTGREPTKEYSKATYYLGNSPIPELYGGLATSFSWKGFDPRGSFRGDPSTASFVPVRTLSLGVNVKF